MANNQVMRDDIVWLKPTAPIADGNGRYWLVVDVRDKYIEIASLSTGKRHGTTMDDVQGTFRLLWAVDAHNLSEFSENEIKVMKAIASSPDVTREEIANFTQIPLKSVYKICHRLSKQNYLSSRQGFYKLSSGGRKAIAD